MLSNLHLLTLAAKSKAAQQAVVASKQPDLLSVLTTSPYLDPAIADDLAKSSHLVTSQLALFRCQDPDVLVRGSRQGVLRARWAFRNPAMPESEILSTLHADNDTVVLAKYLNPTTPLDFRQETLTPDVARRLVDVRGTDSFRVVRGFELAISNSWMADTPDRWHRNIKRGLAGLPCTPLDRYLSLTKGRTPWPAKSLHPAVSGIDLDRTPIRDLISLANPAVDLYLLQRSDLSEDLAAHMVARPYEHSTEPHIIGRLVERFGVGVLYETTDPMFGSIANSRKAAACFTSPAAVYACRIAWDEWADATDAVAILGENPDAWEVAIGLGTTWQLGLTKLAESAIRLSKAT